MVKYATGEVPPETIDVEIVVRVFRITGDPESLVTYSEGVGTGWSREAATASVSQHNEMYEPLTKTHIVKVRLPLHKTPVVEGEVVQ